MIVEVKPEELKPGDIVVWAETRDGCCGHLETRVKVSRSPYSEEARPT